MSTFAATLPTPRSIGADLLKLRRRRGLIVLASLLTVGAMVVTYGLIEIFHRRDRTVAARPLRVADPGRLAFLSRSPSPRTRSQQSPTSSLPEAVRSPACN